jgi:hypothetical protein
VSIAAEAVAPRPLRSLLYLIVVLFAISAHAEGIHVKSAELVPADQGFALNATYEIMLTPTLEEALVRGLTLTFVTEFELVYPRWWTLNLWNGAVTDFRARQRLSYNALTRQYRLSFGSLHQNFDTLQEALSVLGRVRRTIALEPGEVEPGRVYEAALRLRLDTSRLPKPLQIDALASRDWNLTSDWYRWTFTP